jgi:hypothetical protein
MQLDLDSRQGRCRDRGTQHIARAWQQNVEMLSWQPQVASSSKGSTKAAQEHPPSALYDGQIASCALAHHLNYQHSHEVWKHAPAEVAD